jgi:hypothetical protein
LSPVNGFVPRDEVVVVDENLKLDNVSIYPNPVSHGDMLNVKLQGAGPEGFNLAVYDVTGKVLIKHHYNQQEQFVVDVSEFPSGAYILNIRNGDLNFTNKFIVY